MQTDEMQIRELVASWMAATRAGDANAVLSLIAEDAVFLVPGQPVMRKSDFAAATRMWSQQAAPAFEGASEIQEIRIFGEWAFMWTKLSVVVTAPGAAQATKRSGYTLSILKKENGRWLLARDANLLAPAASTT